MKRKPHYHAGQTRQIIALRQAQASGLYIHGKTHAEIAESMGVHRSVISRDLKALREEWRAKAQEHTDVWIAEELARLAAVEAEAWAAWKRSTLDRQSLTRETGAVGGTKTIERTEGQAGDSAILGKILDCIKQRRELLGLDQPKRTELSGPGGGPIPIIRAEDLTDDDLARIATGGSPGIVAEAACEVIPVGFHDIHQAGLPGQLAPPAASGEAGSGNSGKD